MSSVSERVDGLVEYIQTSKILEAMTEFYSADTVMVEGNGDATSGLDANIEREKQFLAQVKEFKSFNVLKRAETDTHSFLETTMEFVNQEGQDVKLEQVHVQTWQDGKISRERFYYFGG
ncbi:MAG: nuclear transport factor 2 family protein [Planctomycetota bacterium]